MKITSSLFRNLAIAAVSVLACTGSVKAAVAYTATPTTSQSDSAAYGLSGFEFTLNQNIDLTSLGFTAISTGGGDAPHVTLWDATSGLSSLVQLYDTGNINSSVTTYGVNDPVTPAVPSYVSVGTPISLTTGHTYLITAPAYWVATYSPTNITTSTDFASASFLTGGGWNGWANSGYTFSALATPGGNYATTANFQYVVSVPEPSTYALLGLGAVSLFFLRRRTPAQVKA